MGPLPTRKERSFGLNHFTGLFQVKGIYVWPVEANHKLTYFISSTLVMMIFL